MPRSSCQQEKAGSVDKSTDVEEEADAVENEEKVDANDSKNDEPDHDPLALGDVPVNTSVAAAKALASTKPVEPASVAVDVQREVDAINGRAAQRASEKMMQTLQVWHLSLLVLLLFDQLLCGLFLFA